MNSGVYELKFASGRTYIGKSINITERFKQHMDKFRKGTAAKAMQNEYDHYGPPDINVLVLCHPDHIDNVESWLIDRNNPELNTTRPPNPFSNVNNIEEVLGMLHMSRVEHINQIAALDNECAKTCNLVTELNDELHNAEEYIIKLKRLRSRQELEADILDRIYALEQTLDRERKESQARIHCLTKIVDHYKQPWWKRWFN